MQSNYADRLIEAVLKKGNPCIVGLDPRMDQMPDFAVSSPRGDQESAVRSSIAAYHRCVIDAVADLIPGVKLQSAFYEQYGMGGMAAFHDTVEYAKRMGLVVIVDAKRNDIASTAEAYANTFLGRTRIFGELKPIVDADCITVSPYLGRDSIEPFVKACAQYGKGIFVLVKTSNPGSADLQDIKLGDGMAMYRRVIEMVNSCGAGLIGRHGYSSIGAVVGAPFPEEARVIRRLMPRSIFLVPGYGAQGATAADAAACFNADGLGAVVNASRSLTYGLESRSAPEEKVGEEIRKRTETMAREITEAIALSVSK